jgi:hypothetical protein
MPSLLVLAHAHEEFEDLAHRLGVDLKRFGALLDAFENLLLAVGVVYPHTAFLLDTRDALGDVRTAGDALDDTVVDLLYLFAEFVEAPLLSVSGLRTFPSSFFQSFATSCISSVSPIAANEGPVPLKPAPSA